MTAKALVRLCGVIVRIMTALALVPFVSDAQTPAPAPGQESATESQKSGGTIEPHKVAVRIMVWLAGPQKDQSPQPLARAIVKIRGEDDSYETGDDGRTPTLAVVPGSMALVVKARGADACTVNVSVKDGPQVIGVLVEVLPTARCTLLP